MSLRAVRALLGLAVLIVGSACAEEKADPDFAPMVNPVAAGDGGMRGDAGAMGATGGKSDGGLDFAAFDDAVNKFIETYNKSDAGALAPIKGASAIVADKKTLLHKKGYGEFAADRLYLIASASKILSVGILMKLADEGKIDLDAPIGQYLGEEWGETAVGERTTAQLLSNSSGMPTLAEVSAAAANPTGPLASNLCQYNAMGGPLQTCGKTLYETPPPNPADTVFGYGGSQWQLAGALAEKVSGKSWAELVDETYVKPCSVPSLGYTNQFARSSTGYPNFFEADPANVDKTDNPSIEGGAYITALDYAKLLQMHMNGGKCGNNRVLSENAVKRMQENRIGEVYDGKPTSPAFTGYGLGWWTNEEMGFVADPGAYGAFPWIDTKRGYAAMVIIEVTSTVGGQLVLTSAKPALDAIFDKLPKK